MHTWKNQDFFPGKIHEYLSKTYSIVADFSTTQVIFRYTNIKPGFLRLDKIHVYPGKM